MKALDPIKEAQAVKAIKATLEAIASRPVEGSEGSILTEDEQLLLDTVEGETGFFEACDLIMEKIADDQAMVAAIRDQESNLKARRERFAQRVEIRKALIEQAFIEADLPKVERPLGTLYLSNRARKVIVETESDIPAQYWKAADPVLDQKQLLADLKARADALAKIPAEPGEARDLALTEFAEQFPQIPGATLSNGARSLRFRTA